MSRKWRYSFPKEPFEVYHKTYNYNAGRGDYEEAYLKRTVRHENGWFHLERENGWWASQSMRGTDIQRMFNEGRLVFAEDYESPNLEDETDIGSFEDLI